MKKFLTILIFFALSISVSPQHQVRVTTYNIRNYTPYNPTPTDPNRKDFDNPHLKRVLDAIGSDIIACQEVLSQESVDQFLNDVLNPKFKSAPFVDGYDTDNALFYKDSLFTFLYLNTHPTALRLISEFGLVHKFTNDTLIVFVVHLKANTRGSDNIENMNKRNAEAKVLRNRTALINKSNFIVVGDFNTLKFSEPAFQTLIDKSAPGYLYDPLNAVGDWVDNPAFAQVHTISSTNLTARFDMILISQAVKDMGGIEYINNSYKIFGNDGNHYSKAVNNGFNYWFSDAAMGTALTTASDHLPVYADFNFGIKTDIAVTQDVPSEIELMQNYPNPFNPTTTISYSIPIVGRNEISTYKVTLKIYDILGREVATLVDEEKQPGTYEVKFNVETVRLRGNIPSLRGVSTKGGYASSVYFYQLKVGNFVQTKKMVLLR